MPAPAMIGQNRHGIAGTAAPARPKVIAAMTSARGNPYA